MDATELSDKNQFKISIKEITVEHAGQYTCRGTTSLSEHYKFIAYASLTVLSEYYAFSHRKFILYCSVLSLQIDILSNLTSANICTSTFKHNE